MKRFIVFCYGDSAKLSTWSNVPFLLTDNLIKKGHSIQRVNIYPPAIFRKYYDLTLWRLFRLLFPNSQNSALRSWISKLIIERKIRKAVRKNSEADYCFFFGFDYYNRFNSIPSILLGDWTFEFLLKERLHKQSINCFERRFIRQQNAAIRNARLVVSLFPDVAKRINLDVPEAHVHYLGRNVVNDASLIHYSEQHLLQLKRNSTSLLFIGRKNYLEGAELLIRAFLLFNNKSIKPFSLHIIGLSEEDFGNSSYNNVFFHGYLDKADKEGNLLYYQLLSEAKLIINPTPGWAGYSSIVEAMFYYTPVIVSPFPAFVEEFGKSLSFGHYISNSQPHMLADMIQEIIESPHYLEQCLAAHAAVEDYTWDSYVNNLLRLL